MQDPYLRQSFPEDILVDRAAVSSKKKSNLNHYHYFYELYLFLGEEMEYFIENKVYTIRNHDIVLIDKLLMHRTLYSSSSVGERILVLFNPDILHGIPDTAIREKVAALFNERILVCSQDRLANTIKDKFLMLYEGFRLGTSPVQSLKNQYALLELLLSLTELSPRPSELSNLSLRHPKEKRVYEIIAYINENYENVITLDILSKRFFVDRHYLCHIFKEVTGVTVVNMINARRLSEAERLLRYSTSPITDICHAIGFSSMSYFISLFRKAYECSPSQFRKKMHSRTSPPTTQEETAEI